MCLRVYLFGFTSECVAASRMSVLGCALLFYMCEYCKKKVCAAFSIPVCLCVCVNSPSSTFGAMQKASNAFHVSEPSVFVRVCVCVCVKERESESGSILLTCLPWCRAYGASSLRFTT